MTDTPQSQVQLPSPGRIVLFESATGSGTKLPAIVLRTRKSTDPEIIERWGPNPSGETIPKPEGLVAELPDDYTIDLVIFGLASDYREYAGPHTSSVSQAEQRHPHDGRPSVLARTWDYPPRV